MPAVCWLVNDNSIRMVDDEVRRFGLLGYGGRVEN